MESIQKIVTQTVDRKRIFGISLSVRKNNQDWDYSAGNLFSETPYFIASTTKLFITTLILQLIDKNRIALQDKIGGLLPSEIVKDLHILKGKEYSHEIRVGHLLAHTSGLPDYFQQKRADGKSLMESLLSGNDEAWSFEQVIDWTKKMSPHFSPGKPGKAHYSDTNFQLLGRIAELLYEEQLPEILHQHIFHPLGLENTYLYKDPEDRTPNAIYYKKEELLMPKAMSSFGADGGIVSNSKEMMIFLQSFFKGGLFNERHLPELQKWNRIFYPLESGVGIHRFKVPWYFSPFKKIPDLLGHSGLSGAFAFHCADKDIYLTGTVNQIDRPGNSFRLMLQVIGKLL